MSKLYDQNYKPGESFGEHALHYKVKSDMLCYALDRETFNMIVKASVKKYTPRNELGNVKTMKRSYPRSIYLKVWMISTELFCVTS